MFPGSRRLNTTTVRNEVVISRVWRDYWRKQGVEPQMEEIICISMMVNQQHMEYRERKLTRNSIVFTESECHHIHCSGTPCSQFPERNVLKCNIAVLGVAVINTIHVGALYKCFCMNCTYKSSFNIWTGNLRGNSPDFLFSLQLNKPHWFCFHQSN